MKMERRAMRIVKAVVLLLGILVGVFLLVWLLLCLTTFFSNYLRRLLLAMNDDHANIMPAAPDDTDDDDDQQRAPQDEARQLDKASIDRLPLVVYHAKVRSGGDDRTLDCGVCLADFQEMESLRLLPACQHCFHPSCIDTWLSSHSTCPLCRQSQLASPPPPPPPPPPDAGRLFSIINITSDLGSPPVGRA